MVSSWDTRSSLRFYTSFKSSMICISLTFNFAWRLPKGFGSKSFLVLEDLVLWCVTLERVLPYGILIALAGSWSFLCVGNFFLCASLFLGDKEAVAEARSVFWALLVFSWSRLWNFLADLLRDRDSRSLPLYEFFIVAALSFLEELFRLALFDFFALFSF